MTIPVESERMGRKTVFDGDVSRVRRNLLACRKLTELTFLSCIWSQGEVWERIEDLVTR